MKIRLKSVKISYPLSIFLPTIDAPVSAAFTASANITLNPVDTNLHIVAFIAQLLSRPVHVISSLPESLEGIFLAFTHLSRNHLNLPGMQAALQHLDFPDIGAN